MARIAGVDLPKNKNIEIALTYIHGIGRSSSKNILKQLEIDPSRKSGQLGREDFGKTSTTQQQDTRMVIGHYLTSM